MPDELLTIADKATALDWEVAKLKIETRQWLKEREANGATAEKVSPALNHQYWFDASKTMVQNSSSKRLEAAKVVQTMIGWLWGVYTAGAIIGVSLSDKALPLKATLLIAAPVPILLIAYWLAVWAQVPVAVSFDSRIPESIREAYYRAASQTASRLNKALFAAFLAAIVVAIGLVTASVSKTDETGPTLGDFVLHHEQSSGQNFLLINGQFAKSQKITFEIIENPDKSTQPIRKIEYKASEAGAGVLRVPLNDATRKVLVIGQWENKDLSRQKLEKIIELPAG